MKLRSRILAVLMALLLAAGMPLTALAETYDLNVGSVTIDANESGQTVTQNEVSNQDSNPVITSGGDKTSNTITVNTNGGNANVTLDNVNINSDGAAMEVNRGGRHHGDGGARRNEYPAKRRRLRRFADLR